MDNLWTWNEDLEMGIEEIDEQHKLLFQQINEFTEAIIQEKKDPIIKETINFLEIYIKEHFTAEERLQQTYTYPDYASHKAAHEKFINNLKDLKKQFEHEGTSPNLSLALSRTINFWLIEHIGEMDKALADFLKTIK